MTDKVVNFPGGRGGNDSPPTPTPPDPQRVDFRPQGEVAPYINIREGIWPMAGLNREQRERLWHLWDMCDHLKRACTNATGTEGTTLALSHALKNLMGQLNYRIPENGTDEN